MGGILPADIKIGTKDAVHVAVISAIAGNVLKPGEDVYHENGVIYKRKLDGPPCVGIVDPFLDRNVAKGQRVWLFLYPRTITGLTHVWSHPSFPDEGKAAEEEYDKEASEAWIKDFAQRSDGPGYHVLMGRLVQLAHGNNPGGWGDDDYLHFNDIDAHGEIPPELYDHAERVLGQKITIRPKYFSCSC